MMGVLTCLLSRPQAMPIGEIAERTGLSTGKVESELSRLEAAGLVIRVIETGFLDDDTIVVYQPTRKAQAPKR